jgi:hypothetical protein
MKVMASIVGSSMSKAEIMGEAPNASPAETITWIGVSACNAA